MNTPWHTVMEEFRGRRLAVHDDLARGRPVAHTDPNVENALGWLIYHRLATLDHGALRACDLPEAKRNWQEHGPATNAAQILAAIEAPAAGSATPAAPARPRAHDHQAQLFGT